MVPEYFLDAELEAFLNEAIEEAMKLGSITDRAQDQLDR